MLNVSLGPITLQLAHVLLFFAFIAAAGVGRWVGRIGKVRIGSDLADMLLAGIVAGRLTFVAIWFEQYRGVPWSMLDIRDGGVNPWAALAAALSLGAWRAWRRKDLRAPLAAGLLAGAFVWSLGTAWTTFNAAPQKSLPTLALAKIDGAPVTLAAIAQGRPIVVNLWATWCPPCRHEMPVLAAAQQREREMVFVFVNQGEAAATVTAYLGQTKLQLENVVLDPTSALGPAAGSTALPTTLFYDANGALVGTQLGILSAATLESQLAALRKNAR